MSLKLTHSAAFRLEALHVKYGDYVRISPNMVSTIDAEAWKEVYRVQTKVFRMALECL